MILNHADQGRVAWNNADWFVPLAKKYSSRTFNERRRMLCACMAWAIESGLVTGANPYRAVPAMQQPRPTIQPFSADEVQRILRAFSTNQFVHPNSHYSHDHYVVFVLFLFTYGSRLGEARALTWGQIDWDRGLIRIDRAMGRDTAMGPYRTRPIVKQTKTGEVNWLPLMPTIRTALEQRYNEPCAKAKFWGQEQVKPKPEALVFPGHQGGPLNIRRFWVTCKAVLTGLDIPYRDPCYVSPCALLH